MSEDQAIEELWGTLCPDMGPGPWADLVRWVARNVNAPAKVARLEALEAVVKAVKKRHAPLTGENFRQRICDGGKELNEALAALQRLQERGQ